MNIDEQVIINGINKELGLKASSISEVNDIVEKERCIRFENLVKSKFSDNQLLKLLELFEIRNDSEINHLITDNADIPTIFEYVIGILWYKLSEYKGKILDFMKLSLDADLLPKTHAAGGEADIVYEYEATFDYPEHGLLLEATLSDRNNQRRMEMEPVSRHLGQYLLRTGNLNSYCVFIINVLNINVISDFRSRKNTPYYDVNDYNKFIEGMKIIPLDLSAIKEIIKKNKKYRELYSSFEKAFNADLPVPQWKVTDFL